MGEGRVNVVEQLRRIGSRSLGCVSQYPMPLMGIRLISAIDGLAKILRVQDPKGAEVVFVAAIPEFGVACEGR